MNELYSFIKTKLLWHPVKTFLLIFTIGISTLLFITSLGISNKLNTVLLNVSKNGTTIMTIVNAKKNADGTYTYQFPPLLKPEHKTLIMSEIPEITHAAIITQIAPWERIIVDNKAFRPSRPVGGDEFILDVLGLKLIYGTSFSEDVIKNKKNVMLISEAAAQALWGDASSALGKTVQINRITMGNFQRNPNILQQPQVTTDVFTVIGIYNTPSEIERSAYSASDFIIPYTAQQRQGVNARVSGISAIMVRTKITSPDKLTAKIQTSLAPQLQDSVWLSSWKGGASQQDAVYLESSLDTAKRFSIIINGITGFIVIVSVLGILSALLLEVMDHRKTLGIMRTLGMTKHGVIKRFVLFSFFYGLFGVIIGCIVALISGKFITSLLIPLFELLNLPVSTITNVVTPASICAGMGIVLALCIASSLAPAFTASRLEIIDTIKAE